MIKVYYEKHTSKFTETKKVEEEMSDEQLQMQILIYCKFYMQILKSLMVLLE